MSYKLLVDTVHDDVIYLQIVNDDGKIMDTFSTAYEENQDSLLKVVQDRLAIFTNKVADKDDKIAKVKALFEGVDISVCLTSTVELLTNKEVVQNVTKL